MSRNERVRSRNLPLRRDYAKSIDVESIAKQLPKTF
jgi:hypothetical protein